MIKAVIFDFFGVVEREGEPNKVLLSYIRTELKPKYKIGIISNAVSDWIAEILEAEDVKLFDDIVISYKVGINKPNPTIYQISLKNLGVMPEETVFIDDIEAYCEAARAVGMQAILYQDFEQMKKELEKLLAVPNN
ncbi:MAG: HAD-IA family hydrolase [Candidatus Saccharimonadales bacterium]